MTIAITTENKNTLSITNESKKGQDITWADASYSWADSDPSTWGTPRYPLNKESKNSLSITNENKN